MNIERRDFTVIFPIFFLISYSDSVDFYRDFLTALVIWPDIFGHRKLLVLKGCSDYVRRRACRL